MNNKIFLLMFFVFVVECCLILYGILFSKQQAISPVVNSNNVTIINVISSSSLD